MEIQNSVHFVKFNFIQKPTTSVLIGRSLKFLLRLWPLTTLSVLRFLISFDNPKITCIFFNVM